MPLSSKERTQLHRERVKMDMNLWKIKQTKDTERKKKARAERSELQKDGDREQTRQRVAAFRQRQKEKKVTGTSIGLFRTYATAYTNAKSMHATSNGYANKRSLGRAVSRSRHSLPDSSSKAEQVVRTLASSIGILPKLPQLPTQSLPSDTMQAVVGFYKRDDISRQAPGKKDYITIRKEGGK